MLAKLLWNMPQKCLESERDHYGIRIGSCRMIRDSREWKCFLFRAGGCMNWTKLQITFPLRLFKITIDLKRSNVDEITSSIPPAALYAILQFLDSVLLVSFGLDECECWEQFPLFECYLQTKITLFSPDIALARVLKSEKHMAEPTSLQCSSASSSSE